MNRAVARVLWRLAGLSGLCLFACRPEARVTTFVDGARLQLAPEAAKNALSLAELPRTGWQPWDLAVGDDRLYVSDTSHHRILAITATGVISEAAGVDSPGDRDGLAGDARLREPLGLSWSAQGLLIADSGNRAIRRLSQGRVSTEAFAYPLQRPISVARDSQQRLVVGDAGSGRILRQVTGGAPQVLVQLPAYRQLGPLRLGPDDSLYFADNEGLWRYRDAGLSQLLAPSDAFSRLTGLAFWQQTLLLSDSYARRLLVRLQSGLQPVEIQADEALGYTGALSTGPNQVYLAEQAAGRIRELRLVDGQWQAATLAETGTQGFGIRHDGEDLSTPHAVLYDHLRDKVVVCDYFNSRLLQIDAQGVARPWMEQAGFHLPIGLAQAADGRIYVADAHRIHLIDRDDSHRILAGDSRAGFRDGPGSEARFWLPWGMDIAADGGLLIADHGNHVIRRLSPQGQVTTVAGDGQAGLRNGPAAQARFHHPSAVLSLADGSLLVADSWNHQLRLINPFGQVSSFSGAAGPGLRDGLRFKARFYLPSGLARGPDDAIYIADTWNHRIRRLLPNGQVETVAGRGHLLNWDGGSDDGSGAGARFDQPHGLSFDRQGRLLVADTANHRIRRIELAP